MNRKCNNIFSLFFLCIILFSCGDGEKQVKPQEKKHIDIPEFNPDTAYVMVEKQLDFGARVSNTSANKKCAVFLSNKLKTFIPTTQIQYGKMKAFNGTLLDVQNIIASYNPNNLNRVMLCSHWDSRPFADWDPEEKNHTKPVPGANDGASGVGILIEIARQLSINKPDIGVDIILFDTEDYGAPKTYKKDSQVEDDWGLGAQYWATNPHKKDYRAKFGILLDMVGAKGAEFYMEKYSMNFAPDVVRKVWNTAGDIGYSNFFISQESSAITDDHYYVNTLRNLPTIDIIHHDSNSKTGFFPFWHTTKDDITHIDKETLKAVGQTLLTVVYNEM